MDKYLEAEKRLAELLVPYRAWAIDNLGAYFLDPLNGNAVYAKRYCSDDAAAFRLMVEHHLFPSSHRLSDSILVGEHIEYYENHPDKATTVRYAIVMAVIAKLEKENATTHNDIR